MAKRENSEFSGGNLKKHVFEHNLALNYLVMTKLHMGLLDLKTKKPFLAILEFPVLRGGKGKTQNFEIFGFLNITRL